MLPFDISTLHGQVQILDSPPKHSAASTIGLVKFKHIISNWVSSFFAHQCLILYGASGTVAPSRASRSSHSRQYLMAGCQRAAGIQLEPRCRRGVVFDRFARFMSHLTDIDSILPPGLMLRLMSI